MDNSSVPQASPEVIEFVEAITESKQISEIAQVIQLEIQSQIQTQLSGFRSSLAQANLEAIETLHAELGRIKEESTTFIGAVERLKTAVAPDLLNPNDEVVSFRQAIDNLEKYGNIIPSSFDVAASQQRSATDQAWSLVYQSIVKILITKLEKIFGNSTIS